MSANQENENTNGGAPDTERPAYDAERIRELRERLYARGGDGQIATRRGLPQAEPLVPTEPVRRSVPTPVPPMPTPAPAVSYSEADMPKKKRFSYRFWLATASVVFFVGALVVSAGLMFFGDNTISGENIALTTSGPLQIGGGEEYKFRVAVANQNAVPIKSATLIIEYPRGTLAASGDEREITIERRALDTIDTGEIVNIELSARMYGEENEEKEIKTRIEYRVDGSNATFEKRAEPIRFKMSTSPVVLTIDSVKSVSSGQEVELTLGIQSNSPTPLSNLLIKMAYPDGFDFTTSDPATVSGEDTWRIATMNTGDKKQISVTGLLTGFEDEARIFEVFAGVPNADGSSELASQLATARSEIVIEKPFLTLGVSVNGNNDEVVVVGKEDDATVSISFANSLDTVIYDGKVTVALSGNALNKFDINANTGFYDSSDNTITWIGAEEPSLREILPGATNSFSFGIKSKSDVGMAAELELAVTASGRRIFDERPEEEIKGAVARTIRIESIPQLDGDVYYSTGPFTNSGPLPPVAGTVTQYTLTLSAEAGANDITGAEVTATIPQYVNWLDLVSDGDTVSYNPTTRTLKWDIGDMESGDKAEMSAQISFRPSTGQVGRTPTLLDIQRFRATDRFTGTVVRTESPALTTRISNRDGEEEREGEVQTP